MKFSWLHKIYALLKNRYCKPDANELFHFENANPKIDKTKNYSSFLDSLSQSGKVKNIMCSFSGKVNSIMCSFSGKVKNIMCSFSGKVKNIMCSFSIDCKN